MTIARILAGRSLSAVVSASADMTMRQAIEILAKHRIGALPVMEEDRVVGIFSERDVLYCVARDGGAALDHKISEVMTAAPITATPDTAVIAALSVMTRRRVRHLPVVEDGRMVGFISIGDLVKHRIDAIEKEAEAMRNYIQAV